MKRAAAFAVEVVAASAAAVEPEPILFTVQRCDTLIGLSRRLFASEAAWREVARGLARGSLDAITSTLPTAMPAPVSHRASAPRSTRVRPHRA